MVDSTEWRIASAVIIGSSHERGGVECQDFGGYRILADVADSPIVLFVSDGAGSATRSREGAEFVCNRFAQYVTEFFASGGVASDITRATCETWLVETREALREVAIAGNANIRDFACTFLGAILGKSGSRFIQIGDGAIVFSDELDKYAWAAWPEQTEYANVTYFVTQSDAEAHLQFESGGPDVYEVALFSDGLQRLALHMVTKTVHDPFFRHIFSRLRTEEPGVSKNMDEALQKLLSSPEVLSRTDDDKTIVMATRLCLEDKRNTEATVQVENGEVSPNH